MKRLYIVDVEKTFHMVVLANDSADAEKVAARWVDEEDRQNDHAFVLDDPTLLETARDIPGEWKGAIPWGEDNDRSVETILAGEES